MSLEAARTGDLENWYSEEQAAERLNISVRSFQRLIAGGASREFSYAPEKRRRARDGGRKPESVFNPDEVDNLASLSKQRIVPQGFVFNGAHHTDAGDDLPQGLLFALKFMEQLSGLLERRNAPQLLGTVEETVSESPAPAIDPGKLWLSIAEASAVSGLSKALIRRIAPYLGIRDGGQWRISRQHLADADKVAHIVAQLARLT